MMSCIPQRVFYFPIKLALAAITLAHPAASISTSATVTVCFAPEEEEFRARHRLGMAGVTRGWRRLSPSAELMVDAESGARCAIRDTGAPETERYFWTVTVFDYHQLAAGRTRSLQRRARRRRQHWRVTPRHGVKCRVRGVAIMADRPLPRLLWRALDRLDYWLMQARLWIVDAVYGPFPDGDTSD